MSKLTRAQRAQLSDEDFADSHHRTYPIIDGEDVKRANWRANFSLDAAGVRRRIAEIAARKDLPVPPSLATFKLQALARLVEEEGLNRPAEATVKTPEKLSFAIRTPEDLACACEEAAQRLAAHQQKKEDNSMSTNFAKKHQTPEGQYILQNIHDQLARSGAVCQKPQFVAAGERSLFQKLHDDAVEGGAKCNQRGTGLFSESGEQQQDWQNFSGDVESARLAAKKHVERRNEQIRREREKREADRREGRSY
jgi:hypothetical protein